eukprot:Partr_v1_DN28885_c2_g1_i5_m33048
MSASTAAGDLAKKRRFLAWVVETRVEISRLLVLTRYMSRSHSHLYTAINKYLQHQDQFFARCADGIYFMQSGLASSTQPMYDIQEAIDVLVAKTYLEFPVGMQLNRQQLLPAADIDAAMDNEIASRVAALERPRDIVLRISNGQLEVSETDLYCVSLTLRGKFIPSFEWVWTVKGLKMLLQFGEGVDDSLIHIQQRERLQARIGEEIEKHSKQPLVAIYDMMHSLSLDFAMEMLHTQSQLLFLADDIRFTSDSLSIAYWLNLPILSYKDGDESGQKVVVEKAQVVNRLRLVAYSSSVVENPDTGEDVYMIVNFGQLSLTVILEVVMRAHSLAYLRQLRRMIVEESESNIMSGLHPDFVKSITHLEIEIGHPIRLRVQLLPWCTVYIFIDKRTGSLKLTDFKLAETYSEHDLYNFQRLFAVAESRINANVSDIHLHLSQLFHSLYIQSLNCVSHVVNLHRAPFVDVSESDYDSQSAYQSFFQFRGLNSWYIMFESREV